MIIRALLVAAVLLMVVVSTRPSSSVNALSTSTPRNPLLQYKVKAAMAATTASHSNVSKAYEACNLWNTLPIRDLPSGSAQAIALALHATCLARVGRDADSVELYMSSLALEQYLDPMTLTDVRIQRAYALQRLMMYEEAISQFLDSADTDERGVLGGVTCCLRLGQVERAIEILELRCSNVETHAMLAVLLILQGRERNLDIDAHLTHAAFKSPLYRWIARMLGLASWGGTESFDHLELSAINQSPFDDPLLIELDDKVKLHRLLSGKTFSFWPTGFVVPGDIGEFHQHVLQTESPSDFDWILKSKSGYGSHGNQVMTAEDVLMHLSLQNSTVDESLCQRMVEPPMLLKNRKFSIRIYVYYFTDGSVYLSNFGLVKLASQEYHQRPGNKDDRMHMTNSGREDHMIQYDLDYLKQFLQNDGWSFDEFWSDIETAVLETMNCFNELCNNKAFKDMMLYRQELALLGIPKILGFDFMVNESCHPILLEVNRFPGLEPRGDGDEKVKNIVVRDAWFCALRRMSEFGNQSFQNNVTSYTRLSLD